MGELNRQTWIVPDDDAALRPAKGFPCRSRQDCRSLSQWILVLVAGDEAKLVSTIKEDRASPFSDNLMHGLNRKWEEGHGSSQRDHTWSNQRGYLTEEVQVHFEFNRIKGNIDDLESSYTGRPIDAITGVTSDGLRHAHDHVSRLGKGSIHGQIADLLATRRWSA